MVIEITENDTPIEVAEKMIKGSYECDGIFGNYKRRIFNVDELAEIAGYLDVYVKSHREGNE